MTLLDSFRGKRVLVTGHTGFKGAWLSEWLLSLGAEVAGFSLYVPSEPSLYEVIRLSERVQDFKGDVRSLSQINDALDKFKPEVVFHLAAQPILRLAYDDPSLTFSTNLGGTVNMLEAIRFHSSVKTAVFITTDKCYENVEWEYGYRETDRLGGADPYSASKACAELAINCYWQSYLKDGAKKIASARAGNVIGGGDWAKDRVVPDCMRSWAGGHPVVLRHPHATRPWQHVLEPLSGYLALAANLAEGKASVAGHAFNFGPEASINHTVLELVKGMASRWGSAAKWEIRADESPKKESNLLRLSCDKALSHLSWRAILSIDETAAMTGEWYQDFYAGKKDMLERTREQIASYTALASERGISWAKT